MSYLVSTLNFSIAVRTTQATFSDGKMLVKIPVGLDMDLELCAQSQSAVSTSEDNSDGACSPQVVMIYKVALCTMLSLSV